MAEAILDIDCLPLGEFQTNSYLLSPSGQAESWVVDPGLDAGGLLERLTERRLRVARIVLTHGHADHIAGVGDVKRLFPQAVVTCPAGDAEMLGDPRLNLSAMFGLPLTAPAAEQLVHPGDELTLGSTRWRVLDSSGHTPGGVSYYCAEAGVVLAGDALFAGSVGRCDFPGSDYGRLIDNIRRHLLTLPPETRVLSGHGPETTIAAEARGNPYL